MAAAAAVAVPTEPPQPTDTLIAAELQQPSNSTASATPAQNAGKGKGLRALRERLPLRRAFSTKHASLSTPALITPVTDGEDQDEDGAASPVSPTANSKARARFSAFERYVNAKLAGARKGGKNSKSTNVHPGEAAKDGENEDGPVAVDLKPSTSTSSSSSATEAPDNQAALPAILETPDAPAGATADDAGNADSDSDPEPLPLARKIQSLLSSLPPFLTPLTATSANGSGDTDAPKKAPSGDGNDDSNDSSGTDATAPSTIDDSRLISLLSSPAMMNGSLSRGRQSVWALLDNLRLKSLTSPASGSPSPSSGDDADAGAASPGSTSRTSLVSTVEDDDSVMFYGPLVPDASSQVELARSEIVSVDENGVVVDVLLDDAPLPDSTALPKVRFGGLWPFASRSGTAAGAATPSAPASAKPKPKVLVEKRLWVPSTTQLSLQVMWWGYRLYVPSISYLSRIHDILTHAHRWLPPPVMNLLNDKEIEAAKVGAMLTTALQWLLNNVPASALPPTLQPALALVRSLVPYLGYIGGFVAWSWGALKGFDVGNGVTLTATWLLPIALIPGTW